MHALTFHKQESYSGAVQAALAWDGTSIASWEAAGDEDANTRLKWFLDLEFEGRLRAALAEPSEAVTWLGLLAPDVATGLQKIAATLASGLSEGYLPHRTVAATLPSGVTITITYATYPRFNKRLMARVLNDLGQNWPTELAKLEVRQRSRRRIVPSRLIPLHR